MHSPLSPRLRLLITGGAGFIGSNLVRHLLAQTDHEILNLDKLTYAGNLESLADFANHPRYRFAQVDLCDAEAVDAAVQEYQPDAVMHLAAESHVDRSIDSPSDFIQTNVIGTYNLLQASLRHYRARSEPREASRETDSPTRHSPLVSRDSGAAGPSHSPLATSHSGAAGTTPFIFLHVSTDEVYGSLTESCPAFTESTAYAPHSPYSASKASSDHLARAWHDTYGLPVIVTNCSNNYGPYQFPEKLIPVVILKCLRREPIPVYGKGENIRDWLYVEDHCRALQAVVERGTPGETYNIGGNNEQRNIDLVHLICGIMDELCPLSPNPLAAGHKPSGPSNSGDRPQATSNQERSTNNRQPTTTPHSQLITFVQDRPGHDLRYAIDASKIASELGWHPQENFESGFRKTIQWYLENKTWWQNILSGDYKLERIGVARS